MIRNVLICLVAVAGLLHAQDLPKELKPFAGLVGQWQATEAGPSKTGTTERNYEIIMSGKFLHFRNVTVFPASEKQPKGERHEDWGFFSVDTMRKVVVLRQFHVEGFVNQFVLESNDENGIVLTTESIENLPPGWRARYVLKMIDADHFYEGFYLSRPGGEFSCYAETTFTRVK